MSQVAATHMSSGQSRIGWVDHAKGFCIIFVVMMHSTLGVGNAAGAEGWMHYLVQFAKPFRMPDFFLISGLFLGLVIDRPWRRYFDRKVVHFFYFYVLWLSIQFVFKAPGWMAEGKTPGELASLFAMSFVEPFGTLWFIYMLPVFFVITRLLKRFHWAMVLGAAAVLEILPIHTGWLMVDEFAARFAERYEGKLAAIIVGNEPNLSYEWGYREGTAVDYTNLLKTVYPAIKAANPDVLVLGGALAPTLEPAGSPWGLNDLEYLDQMYTAGAADYFDGLAVHTYGLTFPALADPGPEILNFRRVELVRDVMLRHGDADTKIYITEFGWNDHPRWTMAVRPGQRIQNTLDALTYAEENWPYVEMIAIWAFRFPAPTKSFMDYYTLVTPEFVAKPIYTELQEFTGNE